MELRKSERKNAKIKMALQGTSGSGKTYSSLLLAKGLAYGDWTKVVVIDTENGSADLYSHLGNYNVLSLRPPFTPEIYIQAIEMCEREGMEVIIMDSISHAWDELLDYHSKLSGNSFANWSKVTPRQKAFTDKMLQCNAHVIATMRTKQDYVLNLKDGKYIPEKVGLKAVQRDGLDYEFTLVFDIDIKHFASASKDRTGLYMDKPMVSISEKTGQDILNWCKGSKEPGDNNISIPTRNDIERKISLCQDTTELVDLYNQNPLYQKSMNKAFVERKQILNEMSNTQNFINNGYATNY